MSADLSKKSNLYLGHIEADISMISLIKNAFLELNTNSKQEVRSKRYSEVNQSSSLGIIYNSKTPGSLFPIFQSEYSALWKSFSKCTHHIKQHFGPGYFARCLITQLAPNKKILPHIDPGWGFTIPHRIHWIISTNDQTQFTIDDESFSFKQWELWEINNKLIHSVVNNGTSNRIHVIFDYVRAYDQKLHYCKHIDPNSDEYKTLDYWFERI
ncbi:MAG: aspartyl/asparaginyl beta-hydroxylase domain-containing protein [Pseudobdellovibrio sp.]